MPRYSVIIPTYGRPRYLEVAIQSVMKQTVSDFEIVVVDDCSPKPAAVPNDPRVRLVRTLRNGGSGAARNLGVREAHGEVLTFLDDDDWWLPHRLELAEAALHRAPIALCWQSDRAGRHLDGNVHDTILDATTPNFGATAIHRDCWLPIDESYRAGQDLAWWLAVSKLYAVATAPAQGLAVRAHDDPRTGYGRRERIDASLRLMAENLQYFESHPRACAFRWHRIGIMHAAIGDSAQARVAFMRALRTSPSLRDLVHLARTVIPPEAHQFVGPR